MEDLWRDVVWRTVHLVHYRVCLAVVVRSAKIDDLDRAAIVHINQDVLWLEVAMCNILLVAVSNGLQDLLSHDGSFVLGKDATRSDLFE